MRGRCTPGATTPLDLDAGVPPAHPLPTVKALADRALAQLSGAIDAI